MRASTLCLTLLLGACASDPETSADTSTSATETAVEVTPTVDRGPTEIAVEADANGLWWDAAAATLYIADDNGNRILSWQDGSSGTSLVADLPAPADLGLGQLVKLADGRLVVVRFGGGSAGDIVVVAADKTATIVPGLDVARRRIGLTVAADGTLYSSWFTKTGQSPRVGSVGRLDLVANSETPVVEGLVKPAGVLAVGDSLIIADQDLGQLLVTSRATPGTPTVRAAVAAPDLVCAGPNGSIFTGGANGEVRQVAADGTVTVVESGFITVRGVAYDAEHSRLFIAEHDDDESDGLDHALHILPVD